MTTENRAPSTFKIVCRDTGGCLNHIIRADKERDTDDIDVKEAKRFEQAHFALQRWLGNYHIPMSLEVVKADGKW